MRRTVTLVAVVAALGFLEADAQPERINLGPGINSQYSELQPIVTSDEQTLFFTRKGDPENVGAGVRPDDEDIWYATRLSDGTWSKAKHLEGPFNTTQYDGVRAINASVTHLYLQNQYRADGSRAKGFSVSERAPDGSWAYPVPLDIEKYYNDTTVATLAVSNDERVLILSLKRKDTKGQHDLYVSFRIGPYKYSEPQSIADLNTTGDELAPCIGFDDRTIYVPSSGWGAEDGLHDVFVSRRLDSTWLHWSKPERLPYPINTPSADFYFSLSANADTCYLSSWHETSTRGYGKADIWTCGLPERYRPGTMLVAEDAPSATPSRPDESAPTEPVAGSLFRLDNVYFDVDKSTLRPESVTTLDRLIVLMRRFPGMRIEIQGHTDSDGTDEHNMILSGDRAAAVVGYLIDHGIDRGRLESKGYGEHVPIAPNTTAAGKQLNRRVMALVIGHGAGGK
jgi:outer membrane protein OmpA-like peptidoglycan-associated protein